MKFKMNFSPILGYFKIDELVFFYPIGTGTYWKKIIKKLLFSTMFGIVDQDTRLSVA